MSCVPEVTIRGSLRIKPETDLRQRLDSFRKNQLMQLITEGGDEALSRMRNAEGQYPLRASPSAFLLCIERYSPDKVLDKLSCLYLSGRAGARLWNNAAVRAVYVCSEPVRTTTTPAFFMFQVAYECGVKYAETDPNAADHGELKTVFSLERAVILLPDISFRHALVYCSHFEALRYITSFLRDRVGLTAYSPNLTEEMMNDISSGASPRTATFARFQSHGQDEFGVATIMVADPLLSSSRMFKNLKGDTHREQNAGYYTGHPSMLTGGLGISRRYGRIWTPARLTIDDLVKLGHDIILRVEDQVSKLDYDGRLTYYQNTPIVIGKHLLLGSSRNAFLLLASAISQSISQKSGRQIEREDQISLLRYRTALKLNAAFSFECSECHLGQIAHCPECGRVLLPQLRGGRLVSKCSCGENADLDSFNCDCGHSEPVADLWTHLSMWPEPETLRAFEGFLGQAGASLRGTFYIDGGLIVVLTAKSNTLQLGLTLDDLHLWRARARIQFRDAASQSPLLSTIVGSSREKCFVDGVGPNKARCQTCLASAPQFEDLAIGKICLLRIFGIPIGEKFDGIHSSAEMADIQYSDKIGNTAVRIGIHVKSTDQKSRKLGRGNSRIQSLYAQYCYSLFRTAQGKWPFDVLGIAVPQDMDEATLGAFLFIAEKTGIPLLTVQRNDWLRIACATVEATTLATRADSDHGPNDASDTNGTNGTLAGLSTDPEL